MALLSVHSYPMASAAQVRTLLLSTRSLFFFLGVFFSFRVSVVFMALFLSYKANTIRIENTFSFGICCPSYLRMIEVNQVICMKNR